MHITLSWKDEDELRLMSKQALRDQISAIQTQNRSLISLIDDLKRRQQAQKAEIEAMDNQLTRSIRLPYLVASISEVVFLLPW